MKNVYLILAILGFIAPYYFFLQVPPENLRDLPALIQPLFANNFMRGLTMDLTVAAFVFALFVFAEANRWQMRYPWIYLLTALLVGLSFALPLFLYFRERKLQASEVPWSRHSGKAPPTQPTL